MAAHFHGHRKRLRERLREAPQTLADYEILELFLGHVLLRRDTKPLAKELLDRHESLRGVLEAPKHEQCDAPGVGPAVFDFITLINEFTSRAAEAPLRKRKRISDVAAVAHMAKKRLGHCEHEEMWAAFVDKNNRLKAWEQVSKGTVDAVAVFPGNLFRRALEIKASGFILVHNHPGGSAQPSWDDIDLTKRLQQNADVVRILFIDHLIVTESMCFSIMNNAPVPLAPSSSPAATAAEDLK